MTEAALPQDTPAAHAWQALRVEFSMRPAPTGCRLPQWPDAAPDTWVSRYEALYAKFSRQGGKQAGVFYTPEPLARRIAKAALSARLEPSPDAFQRVRQLKIADPACGTGVFLVAAFDILLEFYSALPPEALPMDFSPAGRILEHQLLGMDIDPWAVAVAEARLLQHAGAASQGVRLNLRCADTLVQTQGQWDCLLGNPPYVSEVRGESARFRALKQNSPYYRAKMDLCDAFLGWSLDHLASGGGLGYVLPEYWMQRSATRDLRQRLVETGTIREVWTFDEERLFSAAPGHHSSVLIWERQHDNSARCLLNGKPARARLDTNFGKLQLGPPEIIALLERLAEHPPMLAPEKIQQGLIMPQGRVRGDGTGLFLLDEAEVARLELDDAETAPLRPFYLPGGFQPYTGFNAAMPDYQLIYADTDFRRNIERYPGLKAHLARLADKNTSAHAPYGLHRPRQKHWFEGKPRILSLRQCERPSFAVVEHPAYVNENFYILKPDPSDCGWMTAILNSTLGWFWCYQHKRKGHRLQVDKDVLVSFPAPPHLIAALKTALGEWANKPVNNEDDPRLDALVANAYGLNTHERALLQAWRSGLPLTRATARSADAMHSLSATPVR